MEKLETRKMFETWHRTVAMLQSGLDASSAMTHYFPVADFNEVFGVMASCQSCKVILHWTE
ncbi:MAG: hypothetical protein IH960_06390 [Chloroflexi bacterium]|nr:hypothetical protein [Chloroflexota bacterium]